MYKSFHLEGLSKKFATRLQTAGIQTQTQFLEKCCHKENRFSLAEKTGISYQQILKWTNQADLERIHGVGEEYADLLEHAGIDSVSELAKRNAQQFYPMLCSINEKHNCVKHMPGLTQLETWIKEAKMLPRMVYH